MKASTNRELFFREQTIANLRIVFGNNVDVVTCNLTSQGRVVVALAYTVGTKGERINVMQTSGLDVTYALRDLYSLSSQRVHAYFLRHNHQVTTNELSTCSIVLPQELESPSTSDQPTPLKYNILPQDTAGLEEAEESPGEHVPEPNSLTVRYLESSHVEQKGYSVLVNIDHPYHPPVGGLRFIGAASRHEVLKVVSQITSEHGLSNTVYYMKTLSIKLNNHAYDILGHRHDHIKDLLDHVLESEKLARIECVYGIPQS